MPVEILMPELGESVHEATVTRWLKKEGDQVKEDEPVVEIMTDKVNTELPAPATGVLSKIIVPEGGSVQVFAPMGIIEEGNGQASAKAEPKAEPEQAAPQPAAAPEVTPPQLQQPEPTSEREGQRKWYSPVVRSIAKAEGVTESELAGIQGRGASGRVTKKDLEDYLASGRKAAVRPAAPLGLDKAPADLKAGPGQEIVPLVGMRKMIAEAMMRANAVPTVSTVIQVDVTPLVNFRTANKDSFKAQYGVKLTYTPFFLRALCEAITEFPMLNASLQGDQLVKNSAVHMGVAVALGSKGDEGLIVPVIRDCHALSLVEIAKALDEIAEKARNNQLQVEDVQGGTFTLTNPGSYGALFGTPMINAPQAAIAGTYGIQKVPVIVDDMIAIRSMMYLVLTYDHRIIDGLLAGRFLQRVKKTLEEFSFFK